MDEGEPPPTDPASQDTTGGTAPGQTQGDGLVATAAGFVAEAPASGGHIVIMAEGHGGQQAWQGGGQPQQASQGGQQARQARRQTASQNVSFFSYGKQNRSINRLFSRRALWSIRKIGDGKYG